MKAIVSLIIYIHKERSKCQHTLDHGESKGALENSYFYFIDSTKPLTVCITTNYGKFVKVWEGETTLHVKEQQLELGMKQLVKNWERSSILPLCLFNFSAGYIMWNKRMDETESRIKVAGRNNTNIRYADDITLTTESEELKSPLV